MKIIASFVPILICLLVVPARMPAADPAATLPAIPASLAVPANQETALVLTARGVQIYECRALPGDATKFEWAFKAPEAELFDAQGHKAGRHYAGPTWELNDGSKVVGKLKAKADSPDGKGIPWLLAEVASHEGGGIMAYVQSVQRIATVGGKAPTEAADQTKAGQERRVEYSAIYVFSAEKLSR